MLTVFVQAFRTPDLRKKLLFTGAMIVLFRFGSNLPAPGSAYLALMAMFPLVALDGIGLGQYLQLSGVSLLVMVVVGLDTVKQIQSQLEQHSYKGFLR
ncbi:MAG: hypothetical protein ACRDPY_14800 [Streptosporangiaceae bacterium]